MNKPNVGVMRQVDAVPGKQMSRWYRRSLEAATGQHDQAPAARRPRPPVEPTMRKQTGRRYGPPPRWWRGSGARPMSDDRRAAIYGLTITFPVVLGRPLPVPVGGTARQRRQWTRMHNRNTWAR